MRWTGVAPPNEPSDSVRFAFENGFDGAVRAVAHPARDAGSRSLLAAAVAEEHSLDFAVNNHPDRGQRRLAASHRADHQKRLSAVDNRFGQWCVR